MLQNKTNCSRIQTHINRVQNRSSHGNREMRLEHFWRIRTENSHGITLTNTALRQSRCKTLATVKNFTPCKPALMLNDRGFIRVN